MQTLRFKTMGKKRNCSRLAMLEKDMDLFKRQDCKGESSDINQKKTGVRYNSTRDKVVKKKT